MLDLDKLFGDNDIHGDKDVIVSNDLVKIQHQNISGSKLMTLCDSGHGIMYDQLEKFNALFMQSITDTEKS